MDSIIDKICSGVSTKWFLLFCVSLTIIPLFFPSTTNVILFVSSSFLQLNLLPIISIGQDKHSAKLDKMIKHLLELEEKIVKLESR